ncbi:MAG: Na(+)-translocating NADH-quinone reductase subunit A [Chlamydiae bacterium]|nr:Na(+)-translocating NADH-quinone reductase subunit A [Chlamydiota bacterium]
MAHIKTKRGLDIPIKGKPKGPVQTLPEGSANRLRLIALDFSPFTYVKPRLLKKSGEVVKIGEPLVEDKGCSGRIFVSPAAGVIKEVRRGLKRRLMTVVIEVAENEEIVVLPPMDVSSVSREQLIERFKESGLFAHIRQRPFDKIADPTKTPRSIFVKAIESTPFAPPPELQVEGHESDFQNGLDALSKMTSGSVHLVYREGSECRAFTQAKNVEHHTAEGPHPIGNSSVHIHKISPIQNAEDVVWTLSAYDVMCIGHQLRTGKIYLEKVISVAGPGILPDRAGYFRVRRGCPIEPLIVNRVEKGSMRFITGNIYTGSKVEADGFLGFYDFGFIVIPEDVSRELLHFFRLGIDKYTASKTYFSGHLDNSEREYNFTTSNHGEHRGFIIAKPYDKVMPMNIPTMHLVKAVMAEDYDLAELYGLLEVAPEDFGPATFVCPSKMEMVEIVRDGLRSYAREVLE